MRTYIVSHTLKNIDDPRVELLAADAAEFVRDLKQPGKRISFMGRGELLQSLLGAELVDEIGLNVHPILLGSGIPTFRDPRDRVKTHPHKMPQNRKRLHARKSQGLARLIATGSFRKPNFNLNVRSPSRQPHRGLG